MSGITNPAEEYFKDGLWGYVTTAWKKLVATAGGALHIQFAGQEADVEVTQTAPDDLRVALYAYDETNEVWRKLTVWPDKNILRVDVTNVVEVDQDTPADLLVGPHGWIGAAWQKQPLAWGYSGRLAHQKVDLNTDAPDEELVSDSPIAGELWVVQLFGAVNDTSDPTMIRLQVDSGGVAITLYEGDPGGAGIWASLIGEFVLAEGDFIKCRFEGCVNGDDIYLRILGYKMKIAE